MTNLISSEQNQKKNDIMASGYSFSTVKRPCVICNNEESRLIFRQKFSRLSDNSSLLSGYEIVTCCKCGFCFADNIPDQGIFDAYYRDMSKYEKIGQDTIYDQARFQAVTNVIEKYLFSFQTRIFEVGCANGQLLSLLKKHGFTNVAGIDPSPVSAEIAKKNFGIEVSANTLSDLILENNSADFIILIGVLEHVRDIIPALNKLWGLLSPHGSIFISVPDASRYPEGEDAPFQEFSVEHINFFSPVSLENLLVTNGFKKITLIQDMVQTNTRTYTPVIHGLFMKVDHSTSVGFNQDNKTENSLKKYIQQSTQADQLIQTRINEIVDSGDIIVVWGTGAHTLRLLASSNLKKAKIRAFVDSNPRYQGKSLNNVPIISPEELHELSEPILISSRVYQEEIENEIRNKHKIANEIIKLY